MKVVAMLSFYNEDPALLRESVSRVCALGVDYLIALDGPYAGYPHGGVLRSSPECKEAIIKACDEHGVQFHVGTPGKAFEGNEVGKRNEMLEIAFADGDDCCWSPIVEEGDWLLVFDSDHMWEKINPDSRLDLHDVFRRSEVHPPYESLVAEVSFAECAADKEGVQHWYEACLLYRAVPGMRYDGAHWRIRFPDGSVSTTLRTPQEKHTAKTIDLRGSFRVRHTVYSPELTDRRAHQAVWYRERDSKELEK